MLYIPKIDNFLKILTDEKIKDFESIHFSEYLKLQEKNKILENLLNRFISF